MIEHLRKEGVDPKLLDQVQSYVDSHYLNEEEEGRLARPLFLYYGRSVWEEAIASILAGENILLVGPKATGKNVLAENIAWLFHRPSWTVSFNVNTDADSLLGSDTFRNGQVEFRKGPIIEAAEHGGYGILDEINMARNDAVAVLHAALDFRRFIDLPGYDRIDLSPETRFIATMNYGYMGTRELNEALTSRFMVIQVPMIGQKELQELLRQQFPSLKKDFNRQMADLFYDLQQKSENAEISTKAVDLRGLISAIGLMDGGLDPYRSLQLGLTNKTFDPYEQELVNDVIELHLPKKISRKDIFNAD